MQVSTNRLLYLRNQWSGVAHFVESHCHVSLPASFLAGGNVEALHLVVWRRVAKREFTTVTYFIA